jgi:hypothetical protein
MEGLLILAVVAGVAVGVGFTTWQLSRQVKSKCTWVVDAAEDLSALEKCLNHLSEEGFGIHRILTASTQAETERPAFVVVGRRTEDALPERNSI